MHLEARLGPQTLQRSLNSPNEDADQEDLSPLSRQRRKQIPSLVPHFRNYVMRVWEGYPSSPSCPCAIPSPSKLSKPILVRHTNHRESAGFVHPCPAMPHRFVSSSFSSEARSTPSRDPSVQRQRHARPSWSLKPPINVEGSNQKPPRDPHLTADGCNKRM